MNDINREHINDQEHNETEPAESYVRPAIISLLLYFVLWVPGFLLNAVYLSRALGDRRRTGESPEGMGCLIALLIVGFGGPVIAVCVMVIISLGEVA
jgi:hypothetical protein